MLLTLQKWLGGTMNGKSARTRPAWSIFMTAAPKRPGMARALLAAVVALAAVMFYGLDKPGISLTLQMSSTIPGKGEIFFTTTGVGYSQDRSVSFQINPDGRAHTYEISLPQEREIDRIRIDPGSGAGRVSVNAMDLHGNGSHQEFNGEHLHDALGIKNQISVEQDRPTELRFVSEGKDPYFDIRLPQPIDNPSLLARFRNAAMICAVAFLLWLLLEYLATQLTKSAQGPGSLQRKVRAISGFASDDRVLRVDGRMLLAFASIALFAALYVAMGLNQSSVGLWETVYPFQPVDQNVDLGTPKRIRSDEWSVQTPWILSQVLHGSPIHNPNVGGESSPLLASLPVNDAIGLPEFKFAGFRVFGIERGVSWFWAYKTFALLLSFLWLCLVLTRGNLAASLLGSAWIFISSFTQWWFSSGLPEIMIAFAVGVTGAIYALFSEKRGFIVVGCALMLYSASNLALTLYPPFIVPLAYLGLAILAGYAIQYGSFRHIIGRFRILALALTSVAIAAYAVAFVGTATDAIDAMLSTTYPGQRVSASGGVPLAKVLYGYFEAFRLGEAHFPFLSSNASEASSFVLLFPLVLLVVPWKALFRRDSALLLALACFCLPTLLWIVVHLPAHLEWVMQKGGWSLVTPKRAVLGLGVGSILACVVLFARIQEGRHPVRGHDVRLMSILTVLSCVMTFGWGLRQADPGFFSWKVIFFGTMTCSLIGAGVALGRTRLMAAGLAIYALPTLAVNPLVSGISAISEKPILVAAARYASNPADKWIVVGDKHFAQGLKAHGLNVFAGSQFLPDRRSIAILDPGGAYANIWNRYATIQISSAPGMQVPTFKQTQGDQYLITLDICGEQLRRLGVTHVAYTTSVPAADLPCLESLPAPQDSGVRLFKLK
jgi:hypothetical protein